MQIGSLLSPSPSPSPSPNIGLRLIPQSSNGALRSALLAPRSDEGVKHLISSKDEFLRFIKEDDSFFTLAFVKPSDFECSSLYELSPDILIDLRFLYKILRINPSVLTYIEEVDEFTIGDDCIFVPKKDYASFVEDAITINGIYLECASQSFQEDPGTCIKAIQNNIESISYILCRDQSVLDVVVSECVQKKSIEMCRVILLDGNLYEKFEQRYNENNEASDENISDLTQFFNLLYSQYTHNVSGSVQNNKRDTWDVEYLDFHQSNKERKLK